MSIKFNEVTWYSKWSAVILFIIILPIWTFYIGRKYEETVIVMKNVPENPREFTMIAKADFNNPLDGTYEIDGQNITFKKGVNIENVTPGSQSKVETRIFGKMVKGDISGDGKDDTVFFVSQETGGTGIFFFVVSALNKNGSYIGTDSIFLGDRIAPNNINIANGEASVNYAVRKKGDPMTADPSVGVTKYIRAVGKELKERGE